MPNRQTLSLLEFLTRVNNHSWRRIKRFVLFWLSLWGSGVSFVSPSTCPCPSFGFYFSFHFIPRVLEGTSQELTWNPTPCHPGQPVLASYWSVTANTGLWLANKISNKVPWVLKVMLMVSPPYSGILQSLAQPATVFKTIWRMLTDKKIPRFSNFPWNRRVILGTIKPLLKF